MIEPFKIESKSEADAYLKDLLSKKEKHSMLEVEKRAIELISENGLRIYFVNKAKEILKI